MENIDPWWFLLALIVLERILNGGNHNHDNDQKN